MKYKSDTYNPTPIQRKNLKKLADYLEVLPQDYAHFDMGYYFDSPDSYLEDPWEISKKDYHTCGTVACAIGHSPLLFKCGNIDSWDDLAREKFGISVSSWMYDDTEWDFLFSSSWSIVDNTAQGAGKRINWFLENGLPDEWDYDKATVALYK